MRRPKYQKCILNTLTWLNILALVGIAAALYFNKPIAHAKIADKTNQYTIGKVPKKTLVKNNTPTQNETFDWGSVQAISSEDILTNTYDPNNLPVIAGISIPAIGINLPIFRGVNNANLMYGAGTLDPNQQLGKGNYGLASHHIFGMWGASSLLFSPLDRAQAGQMIYTTDKNKIYTYKIYNREIVNPTDSYVLDPPAEGEKPIITLVTCTDQYATQRLIVQGELVATENWDDAPESVQASFFNHYNSY